MKIYSLQDPLFARYGKVIEGYDLTEALKILKMKDMPMGGVKYVAEDDELQALPLTNLLQKNFFGGLPVQLGWCSGHNTKLNCLEYHRNSELNFSTEDTILLLAKQEEIVDGVLDTAGVKAFFIPGGVLVELYATTLHYAPLEGITGRGFSTGVALPKGTNVELEKPIVLNVEDQLLFAVNKWLLAHPDSSEAQNGAYIGLKGANIDFSVE